MKPSKKTITTPNRSTTSTPSWLAKTGLLFFVLAFVFFACKEDPNTIGFKPDRTKFRVAYVELDLPSSVLMAGPTTTSNKGDGTPQRLLTGSYTDPVLGKVTTESYLQFAPTLTVDSLPPNATLVSLKLDLSLDYYSYGSTSASSVNFYVHELTDSLTSEGTYTNTSSVDYKPTPVGSGLMIVDPSAFADHYAKNVDSDTTNNFSDYVTITLNSDFGQSLLELAKQRVPGTTAGKTTNSPNYSSFRKFRRVFKGFALRSDATDKIIGLTPVYNTTNVNIGRSRMLLSYSYIDKNNVSQKGKIEFTTSTGPISFSKIAVDRSGTSLQNFDQLYKEFYPANDQRFIQSGSEVVTKFDIGKFFAFSDTIQNMLINSAEIVIDPAEVSSTFKPPLQLGIKILNKKNRFMLSSDTLDYNYSGFVGVDANKNFILVDGSTSSYTAKNLNLYQAENTIPKYSGTLTRYFQMLYGLKDKTKRASSYALFSSNPNVNKSLERFVFNKNNLKLRIYYTTPTTKKQD